MGTMLRGLLLMPFLPGENVKFFLNLVQDTNIRTMHKKVMVLEGSGYFGTNLLSLSN